MSLTRRVIALAEGRQLEELVEMLQREGATPLRCPMVSILDAPDEAPVLAWLDALVQNRFDWVILFTGEGLRRLLACAERHHLSEKVKEGLSRCRILTRGPKPGRALREIGLAATTVAPEPTTQGVIAALAKEPLQGKAVGVQLYSETNPPLMEFLSHAGAAVHPVLPYVYAPAADADRIAQLMQDMQQGRVDAIVLTSSPQIDRLFEVAHERGLEALLREGLSRTKVAAVGPVVADNLRRRQVRVDVCPEQGFVMKNLVQHLKREFPSVP